MDKHLRVIYCRSASIGGIIIRHADRFGRWSHCGIWTPDDTVIESRPFKGVVEGSYLNFMAKYPNISQSKVVEIPCPDPDKSIAWARDQIGKGYDYLSLLGLLTRNSWQEEDRWHCAELIEKALIEGGRERFRDSPWHISPNMSYLVK